jgi:hypothetical protein
MGLDPRVWSYALGAVLLALTAWAGSSWIAKRLGSRPRWWLALSLLLVFEWHLTWAAVSGMEILVLGLLAMLVMKYLEGGEWRPLAVGAMIGLGVWVRPDALTLLVPVIWCLVSEDGRRPRRMLRRLLAGLAGLVLLMLPYLIFNRALSGAWWPSTLYAKQAEYAVLRQDPLVVRLLSVSSQPFIGGGSLLLPGLLLAVIAALRQRSWQKLAPLIWMAAFLGAYSLRLPVTYQHGRYAMPTLPILLVFGVEGLSAWVRPRAEGLWRRLASRVWILALAVVAAVFWVRGGLAYRQDVAIIESEMVAAARWVSANTEPEALVAAHDIGALGYFGERELIDLAGLVSPEVIPILRDERELEALLNRREADYLVSMAGWYPYLEAIGEPVFVTQGRFSPEAGGENMVVYRWPQAAFAP